jgi:putative nucleotidyltransferase with HDIG domain
LDFGLQIVRRLLSVVHCLSSNYDKQQTVCNKLIIQNLKSKIQFMPNLSAKEANTDAQMLKIARATDEFENYPYPHATRIAAIADVLAKKFNLASHDLFLLRQAAFIHDVGEMTMKREYIKANRTLRPDERIDMQRHTVIGEQEAAKRGFNRAVQLLVRWHHEWWNGAGYPDALEREQIPLAARILRVADAYAALTDSRPYRAPLSASEAKRYLTEWAGVEFDPKVVKAFLTLEGVEELASYYESAKT